jgi:hypothetical protein
LKTEEKILWQGDHQHEEEETDSDAEHNKGTIDSRRVAAYVVKCAGFVPTKVCLLIIKKAVFLKIL